VNTASLRAQLQARQQERERIARDLHDTLLQGVSALSLYVQAAAHAAPEGSPVRDKLEYALLRAGELIEEGRDRVSELRVPAKLRRDLGDILHRRCEGLSELFPGPSIRVVTRGRPRGLHPVVADEVYHIAIEALLNAFQHAGASRIAVLVHHEPAQFCLVVKDDGRGLPPCVALRQGERRFGMDGMRERATRIGARVQWSPRTPGTVVMLNVSAARAYDAGGDARAPAHPLKE